MDVARGNQTLFMRLDEVLAAWAIVDPIIASLEASDLGYYRAGSMGPDAAEKLMQNEQHRWINPQAEVDE